MPGPADKFKKNFNNLFDGLFGPVSGFSETFSTIKVTVTEPGKSTHTIETYVATLAVPMLSEADALTLAGALTTGAYKIGPALTPPKLMHIGPANVILMLTVETVDGSTLDREKVLKLVDDTAFEKKLSIQGVFIWYGYAGRASLGNQARPPKPEWNPFDEPKKTAKALDVEQRELQALRQALLQEREARKAAEQGQDATSKDLQERDRYKAALELIIKGSPDGRGYEAGPWDAQQALKIATEALHPW
jgi:hypothetical protein